MATPDIDNFNPRNISPDGAPDRQQRQQAENQHGRLSMIASTSCAVEKAVSFFLHLLTQWCKLRSVLRCVVTRQPQYCLRVSRERRDFEGIKLGPKKSILFF
mmetsp:Transcript_29379/g.58298  ORF Transcript_29379/g.58298 Transcript_29379/m.58298 type:complete len:102 (+) Transcript_29379:394-699(+)